MPISPSLDVDLDGLLINSHVENRIRAADPFSSICQKFGQFIHRHTLFLENLWSTVIRHLLPGILLLETIVIILSWSTNVGRDGNIAGEHFLRN